MNDHEITWYMQEIAMHGLGAKIDFSNLLEVINNPNTRQTRIVWFHLTSFLAHAAMISKYLSPISSGNTQKERKKQLRKKLNISDNSDVFPRDARDNVEHFDERIDNWVGSEKTILEMVLDDREGYNFIRINEKIVKRVLLQKELIFISEKRNESKFELELQPLFEEVKRIGNEAEEWIKNSSPYHFIYPQHCS